MGLKSMGKRDLKQEHARISWLEGPRCNTLVYGTGLGKAKIALDILATLVFEGSLIVGQSKVLILVDNTVLRDTNWANEFREWNMEKYYSMVRIDCYQSAYRWEGEHFNYVIADEIDFSLTPRYMMFYENNTYDMLLGLTGFVDQRKQLILDSIAPVIDHYTTEQAQYDGILNKTQLVLVQYDLSRQHQIQSEYYDTKEKKMVQFTQSENHAYEYLHKKCDKISEQIAATVGSGSFFKSTPETEMRLAKLEKQLRYATNKRKDFLLRLTTGKKIAQQIKQQILSEPSNKLLTFSMYTDQCDAISTVTYHSKNKRNNFAIRDLNLGLVRDMGVCKAIDRGINMKGVNNILMESYLGSKTQFQQRHGRGCRLPADQWLYLYVMLPYYSRKVSNPKTGGYMYQRYPTQMVTWARSMMEGFRFPKPIVVRL